MRVESSALRSPRLEIKEYPLKFPWITAIVVVFLTIFSIACGAGQPAEQSPESVRSTDATSSATSSDRKLESTVNVKPDNTPEHQQVPKSPPTIAPVPTIALTPTNTPEHHSDARAIPTNTLEPTPPPEPTHTPLPEPTHTPLPEPTHTPLPKKMMFDRSHHVATSADLIKVGNPDTKKALLNPAFFDVSEAEDQYTDSELVIGLSVNGQHKAYSTSFMATWIVNDTVGGDPLLVTY